MAEVLKCIVPTRALRRPAAAELGIDAHRLENRHTARPIRPGGGRQSPVGRLGDDIEARIIGAARGQAQVVVRGESRIRGDAYVLQRAPGGAVRSRAGFRVDADAIAQT